MAIIYEKVSVNLNLIHDELWKKNIFNYSFKLFFFGLTNQHLMQRLTKIPQYLRWWNKRYRNPESKKELRVQSKNQEKPYPKKVGSKIRDWTLGKYRKSKCKKSKEEKIGNRNLPFLQWNSTW
jgi:hypothetical protein